ncbi:hypothetical protein EGT74_06070 [Chitinophaga lutea]|uniref:Uncharacterized protein n=1 Tax=Chitinophaga lutea TaxID=2488634 RepID=A0A3N4Q1M7_9BACT|nr:hypothetical protein [Chitinophaga lutea]RPE13099.1 hypothetical protein EGT74_06070 [Chitinophaga lutea]
MESRLIFTTPEGPMCYVDYNTQQKGASILEELRQTASYFQSNRSYEFSLFTRVKNRLVKTDWFYLPSFDVRCIHIFLNSAVY